MLGLTFKSNIIQQYNKPELNNKKVQQPISFGLTSDCFVKSNKSIAFTSKDTQVNKDNLANIVKALRQTDTEQIIIDDILDKGPEAYDFYRQPIVLLTDKVTDKLKEHISASVLEEPTENKIVLLKKLAGFYPIINDYFNTLKWMPYSKEYTQKDLDKYEKLFKKILTINNPQIRNDFWDDIESHCKSELESFRNVRESSDTTEHLEIRNKVAEVYSRNFSNIYHLRSLDWLIKANLDQKQYIVPQKIIENLPNIVNNLIYDIELKIKSNGYNYYTDDFKEVSRDEFRENRQEEIIKTIQNIKELVNNSQDKKLKHIFNMSIEKIENSENAPKKFKTLSAKI